MKVMSYFRVAFATTYNIVLNALTLGRYVWLEGKVCKGVFLNWARRFRYRPNKFVQPTTEEEIVELVRNTKSIRVFGSAHSFNSAVVVDEALVSLDRYSGLIWKDVEKKQLAVKGGTRVRDVIRMLQDEGLAFEAQPSHDAQSIAGILSTDVHGTGKNWGFVSQSVVALKLVDGNGEIIECRPSDDLFKAAIGGIGAVGIILEVVVQGVDRFNVEQETKISNWSFVAANLDRFLEENDHFSLYLFPFTDVCQINIWNRTHENHSVLGSFREFVSISIDALLAAWFGNLFAYLKLLPPTSSIMHRIKRGTHLVLESNEAFNRTIYHLHQELEFTVPFEDTFKMCRRFLDLYEEMYSQGLPYALFEVRFTPAGHDRTLIGAGRERHNTWIDLVCNDSEGFEKYYAASEDLIREIGARPHLGKYCKKINRQDLGNLHQDNFAKFLQLIDEHDPEGKFSNKFTQRLFKSDAQQEQSSIN